MSTVTSKESLLTLAISKQKETIRHMFTHEEISEMSSFIIQNLQRINGLKSELDEVKNSFKEKINPLEKVNTQYLADVGNGFRDQEIEVYLVPDYDKRIIEFYSTEGEKMGERRMMISETQRMLQL